MEELAAQIFSYNIHSGMRRQSSGLVMASNQTSGTGVLFSAKCNGMVQIPDFRRAHHYKISKKRFLGCQHQKSLFTRFYRFGWRPLVRQCVSTENTLKPKLVKRRPSKHCLSVKRTLTRAFKTNKKKKFMNRVENRSPATSAVCWLV